MGGGGGVGGVGGVTGAGGCCVPGVPAVVPCVAGEVLPLPWAGDAVPPISRVVTTLLPLLSVTVT